jgi:alkylation response protein AidB-like acyl-CoA dehydrogenase
MFALADMITHVEVGASMARKAARLADIGDPNAEHFKAMTRIFANKTAYLTGCNILKILRGQNLFDKKAVSEFLEMVSYDKLADSFENVIKDMDMVANKLFER